MTRKHLENGNLHVINKVKEMANNCARLINQYQFKKQTVFSARFDEQDEDDQVSHENVL